MRLVFENTELLSMRDASHQLGITAMTLHRWVCKGKIQAVKVGAQRAIPKTEVERLESEHNGKKKTD